MSNMFPTAGIYLFFSLDHEPINTQAFSRLTLNVIAMANPQLKKDNRKTITLFFPKCHDEILQSAVPIVPKPLDEPLILINGSLIFSPGGKHHCCPMFHPSMTK